MLFKVVSGILLAVAVYLALTAWLGFSSQEPPAPQAHQDGQKAETTKNKRAAFSAAIKRGFIRQGDFIHDFREEIVAVGTLFIAAFTVILSFATGFLYFATRDLVEGADKNAEKQLRPYVFLSDAKISDAAGTPKIYIKIKNFGQTPAYGLSFWTEGALREYPITSKLVRSNSNHSALIDIGPTGSIETTVDWNGPIQDPDKAALIAKTKAIYVFGKITYRDTFGHDWSTEFRFMEGGEFPFRPTGGDLPHTPDGNKAT
jgi:hypothetical protein